MRQLDKKYNIPLNCLTYKLDYVVKQVTNVNCEIEKGQYVFQKFTRSFFDGLCFSSDEGFSSMWTYVSNLTRIHLVIVMLRT